MKQSRAHLRTIVTRVFDRPDARVIEIDWHEDLELVISWRLGNDPQRPRKRSKTLHVTVATEAIAEYAAASSGLKHMADARLERHLQLRLQHFDPEHQAPFGQEPPLVRWMIEPITLLG